LNMPGRKLVGLAALALALLVVLSFAASPTGRHRPTQSSRQFTASTWLKALT